MAVQQRKVHNSNNKVDSKIFVEKYNQYEESLIDSSSKKINDANSKSSGKSKENYKDNELINMPPIFIKKNGTPSLGVGLAYTVTPCLAGLFILAATGSNSIELINLILWNIWSWLICYYPIPMSTPLGFFRSLLTLVWGVMCIQTLSNKLIRTQYVMATIMFIFGRGNILMNDSYLRGLPISFRAAYLFNFLDLGKAKYYENSEMYEKGKRESIKTLIFSILGLIGCTFILYLLDYQNFKQNLLLMFVREILKLFFGGVFFIFGIYLGQEVYTIPIFLFSKSPDLTLKPKPLMINPWESRTINEWWSARFDTGMQSVLYHNAYKPARMFGFPRSVAMFATFTLSGFIHLPLVYELGASNRDIALMFLFFIVQAIYVGIEDFFKWTPNRYRTLFLLCLSSPLFTYPILNRMGLNN